MVLVQVLMFALDIFLHIITMTSFIFFEGISQVKKFRERKREQASGPKTKDPSASAASEPQQFDLSVVGRPEVLSLMSVLGLHDHPRTGVLLLIVYRFVVTCMFLAAWIDQLIYFNDRYGSFHYMFEPFTLCSFTHLLIYYLLCTFFSFMYLLHLAFTEDGRKRNEKFFNFVIRPFHFFLKRYFVLVLTRAWVLDIITITVLLPLVTVGVIDLPLIWNYDQFMIHLFNGIFPFVDLIFMRKFNFPLHTIFLVMSSMIGYSLWVQVGLFSEVWATLPYQGAFFYDTRFSWALLTHYGVVLVVVIVSMFLWGATRLRLRLAKRIEKMDLFDTSYDDYYSFKSQEFYPDFVENEVLQGLEEAAAQRSNSDDSSVEAEDSDVESDLAPQAHLPDLYNDFGLSSNDGAVGNSIGGDYAWGSHASSTSSSSMLGEEEAEPLTDADSIIKGEVVDRKSGGRKRRSYSTSSSVSESSGEGSVPSRFEDYDGLNDDEDVGTRKSETSKSTKEEDVEEAVEVGGWMLAINEESSKSSASLADGDVGMWGMAPPRERNQHPTKTKSTLAEFPPTLNTKRTGTQSKFTVTKPGSESVSVTLYRADMDDNNGDATVEHIRTISSQKKEKIISKAKKAKISKKETESSVGTILSSKESVSVSTYRAPLPSEKQKVPSGSREAPRTDGVKKKKKKKQPTEQDSHHHHRNHRHPDQSNSDRNSKGRMKKKHTGTLSLSKTSGVSITRYRADSLPSGSSSEREDEPRRHSMESVDSSMGARPSIDFPIWPLGPRSKMLI